MKNMLFFLLLLTANYTQAQVRIHAHNDYASAQPFTNAYNHKAFTIEADVYAINDTLFVAHDKNDIQSSRTLDAMYLQPIIALFKKYNGYISADTSYTPVLMIDIKEKPQLAIPLLVKLVDNYKNVFDRKTNAHAVEIVLSGERGAITTWNNWPGYILFDGRPYEKYDGKALQRIGFISDTYEHYNRPADSAEFKIKALAAKTHEQGKLLRLWAIPDNFQSWKSLQRMGVDIINTDHIDECAALLNAHQ